MNHNRIEAGTAIKLSLASIALALLGTACGPIRAGNTVYANSDLTGSYPYSTSVNATRCPIKAGQHEVQAVDPQFNIVEIDNCWISADMPGLSTTPPKTATSQPSTPDVWIPATPPRSNP